MVRLSHHPNNSHQRFVQWKTFSGSTILFDVRENYVKGKLPSLRCKLLNDLFSENHHSFNSIEDGVSVIEDTLQKSRESSFLIVIDDADHRKQLEALVAMDALNPKSLVIVTTRDERLLIRAGVRVRYKMKQMNQEHSKELFCWHAFHRKSCKYGFESLVDSFVKACAGLPLAHRVLGCHVFGSDKACWKLQLDAVKERPDEDIKQTLKISYDALEEDQKQIFMDIACFFIGEEMSVAMSVWKASKWRSEHALQTLQDKCLLELQLRFYPYEDDEPKFVLRVHDHLPDLGIDMADNANPCRLWRLTDLIPLKLKELYMVDSPSDNLVSSIGMLKHLEALYVNLWDEKPQPSDWKISLTSLRKLTNLKTLTLKCLEGEFIFSNRGKTIDGELSPMRCLEAITLSSGSSTRKVSISGQVCPALKSLKLYSEDIITVDLTEVMVLVDCEEFRKVLCSDLVQLEMVRIKGCNVMSKLPNFGHFRCLKRIYIRNCRELKDISAIERLKGLKTISISNCPRLKNIKAIEQLKGLNRIWIEQCEELKGGIGFKELKGLKRVFISSCPRLQDIQGIESLICVESFIIAECPKLQNITGIEELEGLKEMIVSDASSITCIEKLQRLPSELTILMGRPAKLNRATHLNEDEDEDEEKTKTRHPCHYLLQIKLATHCL